MRIIGVDPGLQKTGWGVIEAEGSVLRFVACGLIRTNAALPLYGRLLDIDRGLSEAVALWHPAAAGIEETFMNNNAASALKLGQARGAALVALARAGLPVDEYAANLVKKSIAGAGHAAKQQIGHMIRILLPASGTPTADEADALAVAICHAHHAQSRRRINAATAT